MASHDQQLFVIKRLERGIADTLKPENRSVQRNANTGERLTPMADPNQGSIQTILVELRDTNKDKRRTAVMKLGMLGGEEAIRVLIRTLENEYEDLIVRSRAALMLGKLGDPRAVSPLIRALDAPGYQTPLFAVEALGMLGDIRAIPPLLFVAENSRDRLQEAANVALGKLGYDPQVAVEDEDKEVAQPETER